MQLGFKTLMAIIQGKPKMGCFIKEASLFFEFASQDNKNILKQS